MLLRWQTACLTFMNSRFWPLAPHERAMVAQACNLSAREVETGGSKVQALPCPHSKSEACTGYMRSYLNKQKSSFESEVRNMKEHWHLRQWEEGVRNSLSFSSMLEMLVTLLSSPLLKLSILFPSYSFCLMSFLLIQIPIWRYNFMFLREIKFRMQKLNPTYYKL